MNYLETIKNITKDKKRKKENLILILVLLVILLISVNYIFNSEDKKPKNEVENNIKEQNQIDSLESKLGKLLDEIAGVENVSVIINYKDNGNTNVVYDTRETMTDSGVITSIEKTVAYNESSGQKSAIVEMYNSPQVEGVIVVASGITDNNLKQKIITSIANLLGIPSYKVEVFEK